MGSWINYLQSHPTELLFYTAAFLVFFLIARVLNVRQGVALAFAFIPVIVGLGFSNPSSQLFFQNLF